MGSSFLRVGSKMDIRLEQPPELGEQEAQQVRTFKSVLYNVQENGNLEIGMPMENGKLILLALEVRYELIIYAREGLYRCIGQVKERYKKDNLYMVSMELKTAPSKLQRREFYRLKCLLDIQYLPLSQEEAQKNSTEELLRFHRKYAEQDPWRTATAMDISGGGMRFVSREQMEARESVLVRFTLENAQMSQEFYLKGHILSVRKMDESISRFENRVKFELRDDRVREQIIRYIFEEERKNRKR